MFQGFEALSSRGKSTRFEKLEKMYMAPSFKVELKLLLPLYLFFLTVVAQPPSQEVQTLLEFKKQIKTDPSGTILNSWKEESVNGCPSTWYGIVCNNKGISSVILNNLNITANIDLGIFANLTFLIKLSLANNSIKGQVSQSISGFKNLQYLDISNNIFSGNIPPDIGLLQSLHNLSLAGNNFSGSIPESISGLTSVQSIDLSQNSLTGAIPKGITRLKNLVFLNLSCNGFIESIPSGFGLLTRLALLDLHQNLLSGEIDSEILGTPGIVYLDLSDNLLLASASQKMPLLFDLSETLHYLNLSHNQLTGSLIHGDSLIMLESLKVLDLSHNGLSGELPGFQFIYSLEVLRLSNNGFSGFIPNGLLKGDSLVLQELDLSANNLSGHIGLISSTTLKFLNLSSNSLSGELPSLIGSCAVLDLSGNQFSGDLSSLAGKWGNSLEFLDLSRNQYTGSLPLVTSQFIRLNYLNLSMNSLMGPLPLVLTQYPKLQILDLSSNQFNGPLLTQLLSSSTLQELHLQRNIFSGNLIFPTSPSNSSLLQVLDISENKLNGSLPTGIGLFTGLKMLDIAGNHLFGPLPPSIIKLTSLTSLDISKNQFTGTLPDSLPDSLQSFNASYNDLSGTIPKNLQRFPESSFRPGNSKLQLPKAPPGPQAPSTTQQPHRKPIKTAIKAAVIAICIVTVLVLIILAILIHYRRILSAKSRQENSGKGLRRRPASGQGTGLVVSADELIGARKGSSSSGIIMSPEKKPVGFSPEKSSQLSWSPESGESMTESPARLKVYSPERLAGELHFVDETLNLTPEELSRAPAEVLGRSTHGTSYRAGLEGGGYLTVKWLREGVAKHRKEFAKEAKKFGNIRHPNVVPLRGYYWGPSQHEKLILSEYISPGSLASFLYDGPGRKTPPLTWAQRLKIAVDVARGLNYLHFDREVPHGNLKATNILLDGPDLTARVADYCLHRLMTQAGTTEQVVDAGMLGYRAPELTSTKKPAPSFKSDVYAFGVILLELLTGKCAGDVVSGERAGSSERGEAVSSERRVDLTEWVRAQLAEGQEVECFDSVMLEEEGNIATAKGMREMLKIALRCVRLVSERPGIKSVYEDLSSI
ncbi:hypothetical protein AMTRI_Chr02g211610 [Amborella trichopoda]